MDSRTRTEYKLGHNWDTDQVSVGGTVGTRGHVPSIRWGTSRVSVWAQTEYQLGVQSGLGARTEYTLGHNWDTDRVSVGVQLGYSWDSGARTEYTLGHSWGTNRVSV